MPPELSCLCLRENLKGSCSVSKTRPSERGGDGTKPQGKERKAAQL